jgi:NTE family protein
MAHRSKKPEKVALLLQGGGALGAYQAGIYAALAKAGHRPDWIAGISIGAINAAIIAGNPRDRATERLHDFWMRVSSSVTPFPFVEELMETAFNQTAAATTLMFGAPGFFSPRLSPPFSRPCTDPADLSYYDSTDLRRTLEDLVDFDLINDRRNPDRIRLSVGAVGVMNGNFEYFDSDKQTIRPEHILASGALPPGMPPVQAACKDGHVDWFWDGGLVSNTPLQYVIDEEGPDDLLAFQVDLFPARGPMPRNLFDVEERQKDIRFSSRTRLGTDMIKRRQEVAAAAARLAARYPEIKDDPDIALIEAHAVLGATTIAHFIYKRKYTDGFAKDYEFSRATIKVHWAAGEEDVLRTLAHPDWTGRSRPKPGDVKIFDLAAAPPEVAGADRQKPR